MRITLSALVTAFEWAWYAHDPGAFLLGCAIFCTVMTIYTVLEALR